MPNSKGEAFVTGLARASSLALKAGFSKLTLQPGEMVEGFFLKKTVTDTIAVMSKYMYVYTCFIGRHPFQ